MPIAIIRGESNSDSVIVSDARRHLDRTGGTEPGDYGGGGFLGRQTKSWKT
jgi:hypothetical protein